METNKNIRLQFDHPLQVRADEKTNERFIVGLASVYDKRSKLLSEEGKTFYEVIERGAFDGVLSEIESGNQDVLLTINHDKEKLLARTKSKTLSLRSVENGLEYSAKLPNTTLGNDIWEQVQRGDLFESSLIFGTRRENIKWLRDPAEQYATRKIAKIELLLDVSIVTNGAYANTDVQTAIRELVEFEEAIHSEDLESYNLKLKLYKKLT